MLGNWSYFSLRDVHHEQAIDNIEINDFFLYESPTSR